MTERRENIARALAAADKYDMSLWCSPILCVFIPEQDHYRRLADAAIAADGLQGRVEELAEQWVDMAHDHAEQGMTSSALIYAAHARHLRAVVGRADSGSATT